MLETQLANKLYSYAFYSSAVCALFVSIIFYNAYLLATAALLLFASALYFHSGHIVNNFLLKRGKVIEIYNGYRLSEDTASLVKRVNGIHYAVSLVTLRSVTRERNGNVIESLVSNIDFPFEFCVGLRGIEKGGLLDGLEEKRRLKEIEITRTDQKKYDRMNALKRELGMLENEIRSIRGQKMLALEIKLKTFANAPGELEAAREACRNAEQISGMFGSSLGLECEILKGERLMEEFSLERGVA